MWTSLTYLYIHLVWSTWKRQSIIDPEFETILYELMREKVIEHKSQYIGGGGTGDQVHLLINLNPTICLSRLVKSIKGFSSFMISNHVRPNCFFKWQGGYGAFSVSPDDLERIQNYIAKQKKYHQSGNLLIDWEYEM